MRFFDLRNGVSLSDEIKRRGMDLLGEIPFLLTQDRFDFSSSCMPLYEKHYPEIIAEIQALSKGLKIKEDILFALFFSMYAIVPASHCSCVAARDEENVIFGRNSDFYTRMKELNSHFIYDDYYGNSTAFLELEDGRNRAGLAIGFTSVFPCNPRPGLNSGLILRLLLEKSDSIETAIGILESIPISSSQTYMMADRKGHIAYVECSSEHMEIVEYREGRHFLVSTNRFILSEMQPYYLRVDDDWNAAARYGSIKTVFAKASSFGLETIKDSLISASSYDAASGHDTVWSVIEDMKSGQSYLCGGNPSKDGYYPINPCFEMML